MKQLRIYFKNSDNDQINWCFLDDNTEPKSGNSLDSDLKKFAQLAKELVFVVPQFWVYETTIDVTDKNAKQLLLAASYQLEDQFAEDVDDLHFAQGDQTDEIVPFVVIKHEYMQFLADFEKSHQITATHIINEMALCALPEMGEVNIYQYEQHCLIKTRALTHNVVCSTSQLDFYVKRIEHQNSDLKIKRLDQSLEQSLSAFCDISQCINLKQKVYSNSHVWQNLAKSFTLSIVLFLLFGLTMVANLWQNNQELAQKISNIQQQQTHSISSLLKNYSTSSHAKTALIKALQNQQSALQQGGFIALFHQFLNSKKELSNIELVKIDYKNDKLAVDVSAKNLQQLDQLIIALKKHFQVNVAQMDSSNNQSRGRFILEQR